MPEYLSVEGRDHRNIAQRRMPELQVNYGSVRSGSEVNAAVREPAATNARLPKSTPDAQTPDGELRLAGSNLPITVKEAARFLGVSPATVYLWVERKQIPHFRVMGRNIRFLISDLRPFRAQFRQEVENGKTA
jgi:excisionase family DNA binding protein